MRKTFLVRTRSEIRTTDECIANIVLGDMHHEMHAAWQDCAKCHLFLVGSQLFARGSTSERNYAKGFVSGWRRALKCELYNENP